MAPVKIDITGSATVSLQPERGIVHIAVNSKGIQQAKVSQEVQDTVKCIHAEIKPLTVADVLKGRDAKPAILRWSSSAILTNYNYEKYWVDAAGNEVSAHRALNSNNSNANNNKPGPSLFGSTNTSNVGGFNSNKESGNLMGETFFERHRRSYVASVNLVARFQDFDALSTFTNSLASVPLVVVSHVEWVLTEDTKKALRARVNREAYANGHEDAKAFAEAMGKSQITPISVQNVNIGSGPARRHANPFGTGSGLFGAVQSQQPQPQLADQGAVSGPNSLTYVPQDVSFSTSCDIKFEIE